MPHQRNSGSDYLQLSLVNQLFSSAQCPWERGLEPVSGPEKRKPPNTALLSPRDDLGLQTNLHMLSRPPQDFRQIFIILPPLLFGVI